MRRTLCALLMACGTLAAAPRQGAIATIGGISVKAATTDADGNVYVAASTPQPGLPVTASGSRLSSCANARVDAITATPLCGLPATAYSFDTDPRDPARVFAGTAAGLFRSSDGGATWVRIEAAGQGGMTAAVDPAKPDVIYAAGAAPESRAARRVTPMRSVDGGLQWSALAEVSIEGDARLAVDPKQSGTLFLCSANTHLRSTDSGASWRQVDACPAAFDPLKAGVMYAVAPLRKSTDHGATWRALSTPCNVHSIAVDPVRSLTLHAVKMCDTSSGSTTSLIRSDDGGASWLDTKAPASVSVVAADPKLPLYYAVANGVLYRSADGFQSWIAVPTTAGVGAALRVGAVNGAGRAAPLFITIDSGNDVYVAKFDRDGRLTAATYLGGARDDVPSGIALGADGAVYVTGQTASPTFPGAGPNARSGIFFMSRLAADLSRVESSALFGRDESAPAGALETRSVRQEPLGIAVDNAGTLWMGVGVTDSRCTRLDVLHPFQCTNVPLTWLYNVDVSGVRAAVKKEVPLAPVSAMAADSRGGFYLAGAGAVWRMKASGELDYAIGLSAALITAATVDGQGNLWVAGSAPCSANLRHSVSTFDLGAPPAARAAFAAKLEPLRSDVLFATCLGGGRETVSSIGVSSAGEIAVIGATGHPRFPLLAPLRSGVGDGDPAPYLAVLDANGEALRFATLLDAGSRAVFARSADGSVTLAIDSQLVRLEGWSGDDARIDAVLEDAEWSSRPLVPGQRIVVITRGVGAGARLLIDGEPLDSAVQSGDRVLATMPAGIAAKPERVFTIEGEKSRTQPVTVSTAASDASVYTADGSGTGFALALNEDGSLNSPANPARSGSVVTIPLNGAAASPTTVRLNDVVCALVDTRVGSFPGLPGAVYQIRITVPALAAGAAVIKVNRPLQESVAPVLLAVGP